MSLTPRSWILAVSGGADSVAMLRRAVLAHREPPIVAHANHQRRGQESEDDEAFVHDLALELGLRFVHTRFACSPADTPATLRAMRYRWLVDQVKNLDAAGVMTAHHAGDQAETVLLRLLRGGELHRLTITRNTLRAGVRVQRPLLKVSPATLRAELTAINQPWREDSSNTQAVSARNRLRLWLSQHPGVAAAALALGEASEALAAEIDRRAPPLPERFATQDLANLPAMIDRQSARDWLMHTTSGPPSPANVADLLRLCRDAASAAAVALPGNHRARRRQNMVWFE